VRELDSTGPPVGAIGGEVARYEQGEATLPEGGTLLLYTDGATEARRGRRFLGLDGFRSLFAQFAHLSPARLTRKLLGRVRAFAGGPRLRDDIALLALRRHSTHDDQ
jgi:serine phosphatase RsbU (regulator of sigma subunit)